VRADDLPLAADYRHFDPERSRIDRGADAASWYTTLANICGTSRAEIEQSDRRRRALQMRARIGASVAAVLVLSMVSLVALDQRLQRARPQPGLVTPMLMVVQRVVARHLRERAGLAPDEAHGGAVTLIRRFGSAANLDIHLRSSRPAVGRGVPVRRRWRAAVRRSGLAY
jgi:hypothetical protein